MWLLALVAPCASFVLPVAPGGAVAQQLLSARAASIAAASPSVSMQEFSAASPAAVAAPAAVIEFIEGMGAL